MPSDGGLELAREFILQGLSTRTHVDVVRELLAMPDMDTVILSVAFVSESGVELLQEQLESIAAKVIVFAGVRNEITSAQAMHRLLKIGVKLYAVDTGARMLVFHPKLYFARAGVSAKLSVGSANLTLGGLNNNVEASVLLDLDLGVEADAEFVAKFEEQFYDLTTAHPQNVTHIDTAAKIDAMLESGVLVDEQTMPPPRPSSSAKSGSSDPTPTMKMQVVRLRKKPKPAGARKVPPLVAPATGPIAAPAAPAVVSVPSVGVIYDLVWTSKALERRDLNIPIPGGNTNVTGSINLDKGDMDADVDHRHYFRDEVFAGLSWPINSAAVDKAEAEFALTIKGVDHGTFVLTISHTTSTTSATYLQRNAMTRLLWGDARGLVQDPSLLGRYLSLYRDKADPTLFMLEID